MGLAAAMTVQRACSEVTMPALEMEMLCCSMASWILVLSASFICNTQEQEVFFLTQSRHILTSFIGLFFIHFYDESPFGRGRKEQRSGKKKETEQKMEQECEMMSSSLTLSNSSMRQTPRSANTRAPASSVHSLLTGCLWT